ncbi:hypothetical protein Tco_1376374 [Tanacetum coccineum]
MGGGVFKASKECIVFHARGIEQFGGGGCMHCAGGVGGGLRDFALRVDQGGRQKVVANALTRKEQIKPQRVRALLLTIGLDLHERILEAQIEALKPENLKNEDVGVLDMCEGQSRTPKDIETVSTTSITRQWKWDNIHDGFFTKAPSRHKVLTPSG